MIAKCRKKNKIDPVPDEDVTAGQVKIQEKHEMKRAKVWMGTLWIGWAGLVSGAEDFPKPYSPPCVERENVFEFTEKPKVKNLGNDKYEITFAVKAACDVAAGMIDAEGRVVRHLGAGVLGANAPAPFQKNSLKQTIYWDGKDDLYEYVKDPAKLRVRVMLGLKPEFDKRLGGTSPKNMPGYIWGIAIGPEAVYVFVKGQGAFGVVNVRKFDHDANYLASLVPPPASLTEDKLQGTGYIEYEPGKRAIQPPALNEVSRSGFMLPGVNGKSTLGCQVALANGRLYFCNAGAGLFAGKTGTSTLFSVRTDGSTDLTGMRGLPLTGAEHLQPRFVASPDGQWLYMTGVGHAVLRRASDGGGAAKEWIGKGNTPGSDNLLLNQPVGIDCDAQGRVYVCDSSNNRIQVFLPDGKHAKSIAIERPSLVRVHQKTGAIYVKHAGRVQGESVDRVSKLASLDAPNEVFHVDGIPGCSMAVDSWTPRARLWLAGSGWDTGGSVGSFGRGPGIAVWEEDAGTLRKIMDFDEEAKKDAGANYMGRWSGIGSVGDKVVCDPLREEVYYQGRHRFDLVTGSYRGAVSIPAGGHYDDFAFDKRGYMHIHLNPGFDASRGGVVRVNPAAKFIEVPYDYGEGKPGHYGPNRLGALPVRDQPGAKFFQDGIGVNMYGDVAEDCNIYYVPKMEEFGWETADAGRLDQAKRGEYVSYKSGAGASLSDYASYLKSVQDAQKRGEEVYSIRRKPGVLPSAATIWTFNRNGELRAECAVTAGRLINGPNMDEDGKLYFVTNRHRILGGKPFLSDKSGIFGAPDAQGKTLPQLGVMVKSAGSGVSFLTEGAPIALEPLPERPPDLKDGSHCVLGRRCWVEGAEWLYAGASPIVFESCSCPAQRLHLDWYKRSYVPEGYRHSIGILDSNGNLIMHLGRYGNYDSIDGAKSKIPVGGDGIACFMPRYVSGTDNYMAYDFRGESLIVLKLNYHAEESVGIGEATSGN